MYHEDIILNNKILQQVHCTIFLVIIIDDKLKLDQSYYLYQK